MKRRELLKRSTLGAAGASLFPAYAHSAKPESASRTFRPFEHEEATLSSLQEQMENGRLTSLQLTRRYLKRIEALNHQGPALHAVIEVNPDALSIAKALDAERKKKGSRGPLHGIPVLLKDNIDTADRMATSAGSLVLEESRPARDAFIVQCLRAAGAVILGKTNLSEWANFRSTRSSSGWSARGGQCRNPYALDRSPSGSSSGTAAAISANMAVVGVGTETDGSITSPSSACGLVGIKPTRGLISRSGIIPISHTQDTAGPMARTVRDAALLLGVLAAADPEDNSTQTEKRDTGDITQHLDPDGLRGARLGVLRGNFGSYPQVKRLMEERIQTLRQLGAEIIDPVELQLGDTGEWPILLYEFKHGINRYLESLGTNAPVRSLKDLIAFNERHASKEMPFFGQEIFIMAEEKGSLTDPAYLEAKEKHRQATEKVEAVLKEHRLDALIAPTDGAPCLIDLIKGDQWGSSPGTPSIAAVAGLPHITVPSGHLYGLPVGLSFIGSPFSEPSLLKLAYAFEQATQCRKPPQLLPTANLESDPLSF